MFKTTPFRVSGVLALALLLPLSAAAQGSGEVRRPYRGLFGGDPNDGTSSSFSVTFSGGYDDNVLPQQGTGIVDPRFQKSGFTAGAGASLTLQHSRDRVGLGLQASTSIRNYDDKGSVMSDQHALFGSANFRPSARLVLSAGGGVSYSPMYSAFLSPTDLPELDATPIMTTNGDYAVSYRPAVATHASAQIGHSFSRRMSLSAGYSLNHVDYVDENTEQRRSRASVAGFYRITRYSSFRVGYAHSEYLLTDTVGTKRSHGFQAGIDYRRPLSLSGKRTTFTVTPGWTLADRAGNLQLHITGSASVDHEMGRTWSARAQYHRGLRFIDGLDSELLADAVSAHVGGFVNRRLQLNFSGQFMLSARSYLGQDYETYVGAARVNYALTHNVAAFANYTYFHYHFGEVVNLPDNMQSRLDRQGVRVGLTFWTSILR